MGECLADKSTAALVTVTSELIACTAVHFTGALPRFVQFVSLFQRLVDVVVVGAFAWLANILIGLRRLCCDGRAMQRVMASGQFVFG